MNHILEDEQYLKNKYAETKNVNFIKRGMKMKLKNVKPIHRNRSFRKGIKKYRY